MKKHKWKDDICIKCGLKRRYRALSKNLRAYYGKPFYDYLVNGEYVKERPECKEMEEQK